MKAFLPHFAILLLLFVSSSGCTVATTGAVVHENGISFPKKSPLEIQDDLVEQHRENINRALGFPR